MTLCIAERKMGTITFASDSRISFPNGRAVDFGVKVFKLPVKIKSAIIHPQRTVTTLYDHVIGMCVVGSTLTSYLIKESIFEILQNLQYYKAYEPLSIDDICNVILKLFQKYSMEMCNVLFENGIAQLIVGGYCSKVGSIRAYYFKLDASEYPVKASFSEILHDSDHFYAGSGAKRATELKQQDPTLDSLHILRQVIKDESIPSVGGAMQYGEFCEKNFSIAGVQDFFLTDQGAFQFVYPLRGINLYQDDFEKSVPGFHISYPFVPAFAEDIKKLLTLKK